jgi:hypothetical protein
MALVEAGAVSRLIELLQSPHENVLDQAACALGNIAAENIDCRDFILALGALPLLSAIDVVSQNSIPSPFSHDSPVKSLKTCYLDNLSFVSWAFSTTP